jgi:hypothetical protein
MKRLVSLPKGRAGEGARVSFRMGILAFGSGFTTKFVSWSLAQMDSVESQAYPLQQIPHHLNQMTRIQAGIFIINQDDQIHVYHQPLLKNSNLKAEIGDSPEFLNPKELHELPKLNNLAEGSIFLISFSISHQLLIMKRVMELTLL